MLHQLDAHGEPHAGRLRGQREAALDQMGDQQRPESGDEARHVRAIGRRHHIDRMRPGGPFAQLHGRALRDVGGQHVPVVHGPRGTG
ncbi:hypothetical protein, partial [Paracidovorax cattleyae]|uniref:hypothetical protein n=1 Tax=Paracidovorax cattleyae TaxID=80868 RepID=UPI001E5C24CD